MLEEVIKAIYRKDYSLLKRFKSEGINLNETDEDGRNALMHSVLAEDADPKMVQFLIGSGADVNLHDDGQNWTALHFAARDQQLEIVKILLENGAKPNTVECFGNTPIGRCLDVSPANLIIVKLLLKYGADPNIKNNYGNSPVDTAKLIGDEDLIKTFEPFVQQ
jgi:ankyrin repeat protein